MQTQATSRPVGIPNPSANQSPPRQTWTADRVELLKHYAKAGFTCAQIAREIGVTRNAVIGKLNRLGLTKPARAPQPRDADSPRPQRPRVLTQRRMLRAVYAEMPRAAEGAAAPVVASEARCTLLELDSGKCRWPVGDGDAKDFSFCGNAAVGGFSYCAGHARMAYRVPARRRA